MGETRQVLWESVFAAGRGWKLSGLTDNYIRVTAHADGDRWNELDHVELVAQTGEGLLGIIAKRG